LKVPYSRKALTWYRQERNFHAIK